MTSLRFLPILLALLLTASAAAQTRVSVVVPESRLWIEGRSTINEFECVAASFDGQASIDDESAVAELVIPVEAFDCGQRRMNRDFYEALKASRFPRIEFELEKAGLVEQDGRDFTIDVRGWLTIAGVTREIQLVSVGHTRRDGHVRITGRMPLSMLDFDITPPTALAGLIKAHERIVVAFDLLAEIEQGHTRSANVCVPNQNVFC